MDVTYLEEGPNYDDIEVKWLNGGPHPGDGSHKCALCGRSVQEGTYVLVDRRNGQQIGEHCFGLSCPEHGDLNEGGHPLKPPDQVD